MKILIAVHGYPPAHSAGAERLAERYAQWLHKHGHEVAVYTIEQMDAAECKVETSVQDDITIHRAFYNIGDASVTLSLGYDHPQIAATFEHVLKQERFDLVHIISGYLTSSALIRTAQAQQLPVVLTMTEYWFMCPRLNLIQPDGSLCDGPTSDEKCTRCLLEAKRRYRLPAQRAPQVMNTYWKVADTLNIHGAYTAQVKARRQAMQTALQQIDAVICPSQFIISKFTEMGYPTTNFSVVRHGLALLPDISPTPQPEPPPLRLGFIGQIKYHKGVDLLIQAVTHLLDNGQPVTLDLWGPEHEEAEYVAQLKAQTASYPAIHWNGRYTGARVWEILASFDALIVPSRWYENSPIVINEANHMRLPVIATRLGGMQEMVQHNHSGLLFELNNTTDLAAQLQRLLSEPALLPQLRQGIANTRTIDNEMAEVVTHYRQVLDAYGAIAQ